MTANVITYRAKSAIREVGKALEFPPKTLDRLSHLMRAWRGEDLEKELPQRFKEAGLDLSHSRCKALCGCGYKSRTFPVIWDSTREAWSSLRDIWTPLFHWKMPPCPEEE